MNNSSSNKSYYLSYYSKLLKDNAFKRITISENYSKLISELTGDDLWKLVFRYLNENPLIEAFYDKKKETSSSPRDTMRPFSKWCREGKFLQKSTLEDIEILFILLNIRFEPMPADYVVSNDESKVNAEDLYISKKGSLESRKKEEINSNNQDSISTFPKVGLVLLPIKLILIISFFYSYYLYSPFLWENARDLVINYGEKTFKFENGSAYLIISTALFLLFYVLKSIKEKKPNSITSNNGHAIRKKNKKLFKKDRIKERLPNLTYSKNKPSKSDE